MNQHKPDHQDDDAKPENDPAGHPRREGNEITGTHEPQPPSGLRPDLEGTDEDGKGGDAGGVGKSM